MKKDKQRTTKKDLKKGDESYWTKENMESAKPLSIEIDKKEENSKKKNN